MRKDHVLKLFDSCAELARFLGLSRSAVNQWPPDKPIPGLQQYRLRELLPAIDSLGTMSAEEFSRLRELIKIATRLGISMDDAVTVRQAQEQAQEKAAARELERAQAEGPQHEDVRT